MSEGKPLRNAGTEATDAGKKRWVTPMASVERVSEATKGGPSGVPPDGMACAS